MKILITGITGFIGSHLRKVLEGEIFGLVRWSHRRERHEGYIPIHGDLRDYHSIVSIIKQIKPEIIVHLGAITPVSLSFERPFDYFEINTTGTINLAEASLRFNPYLKKFVVASTPEVYGIQNQYPIKETAPLNPNSPYAVSKAAADLYLRYMSTSYSFPVVFSRHANCYGRKKQTHFVVEAMISQMVKGKDVYLGDPTPERDFIYVDDVIDFYKTLIEKGKPGEVYNAGWGVGHSIKDVAELVKNISGFAGSTHWNSLPKRPGEILKIILDGTKAKQMLGWEPKVSLEEGLKLTIKWWKSHLIS